MSEYRIIHSVHRGRATQDGAGVSLTRLIGQPSLPRLDPFLMLDFFGSDKPNDYLAGFPSHPHRGFQTVTYMLAGKMRHRDSVGNEGVIEAGGIQWMNAGRGIIHEEMPEQQEGLLQGFQLWVNLPAQQKMSAPGYQDIPASRVPEVKVGEHIRVKVLAGEFQGTKGPVETTSVKPLFFDIAGERPQSELNIPLSSQHNAFVYCYAGAVEVGGQTLSGGQLAVLGAGNAVNLNFTAAGKLILVAGQPIGEPVVQYGPFVMNTEQEIHQAIVDYQSGKLTG
ncbi:pirin family protein [Alteromonas aestuariivivens]|uniref:Pirin family protein n=1 Tax=Alteromonas aestuariivivens TaxID=1938339 RepID=A0A3D8M8U0_9ALTE|nr:pirin family protein [Alteromonas aestuariivivens]RDV26073.1 pirin family protein [Alteromonas aestuariivivens]